ncbi:RNA polymerase III, subunit Rpc25 [Ophiocordyceps sinensis CO18]|uniref:DNA-directed RNA polymerase subunit n=1 Tax=Ophiocordyceps sinensis (strain Co18 / CGMCC 3.14243) TaxID=911162 RepID=T5A1X7_OPHSC|nr:RNA polymerase III, subunit Rpc25 [Ophiocordyceps sinensis CO18]
MFILTKISDLVQIAPEDFAKHSIVAIEDNINAKYSNKVIQKIGLCICLIRSATPAGINLRTDFFDDIFVPHEELPEGTEYKHNEQLWIWNLDDQQLYYDVHETVRFQVVEEEWHDQTPTGPLQAEDAPAKTPYRIKGSMANEGLGVCIWWDGA